MSSGLPLDVPLAGYVLAFALAAAVCVLGLGRVRRIEEPDVRRGLAALLLASGGWAASHVGYLAAPTWRLQYAFFVAGLVVGLVAVGAWLLFCSAYTGRTLHRNRTVRRTAVGVFLVLVLVKVTNPLHHQYFTTEVVSTPFPYLLVHLRPLHWVSMGLAYALSFVGVFMLFEFFAGVGYTTRPLYVVVGLVGLPVVLDVLGALTPFLLDLTYSPLGVSAFAVGVLFVYFDRFRTVRLAGDSGDPVVVVDGDDHVRDSNRAARELFPGLTGATGEPLAAVVPEVADALDGPDAEDPVLELERDDEVRYYGVTTNRFAADGARLGRLVTLTDVTERERYRRELERKNDRLAEFASVVSHDLRNPLTVARGRLEMATEECDSEHLDDVASAHERMELLVDDILTLAREGADVGDLEPVELGSLVEGCWRTVTTDGATLAVDVEGTILADRSRLQQLLENLFRNAVEHGSTNDRPPADGPVEHDGGSVTVTVENLDDGFYVEDDGTGIPGSERDAVFDAGHSTSPDGTGFGLAIVRAVAEAHGWRVRAAEGTDGGARFEVTGVEFTG